MTGLWKQFRKEKKYSIYTRVFIHTSTQGTLENSTRTRVKLRRVSLTVLVCREISTILEGPRLPSLFWEARYPAVMYTSKIAARETFYRERFTVIDRKTIWSFSWSSRRVSTSVGLPDRRQSVATLSIVSRKIEKFQCNAIDLWKRLSNSWRILKTTADVLMTMLRPEAHHRPCS